MRGAGPAPVDRRRARVLPPFSVLTWEESTIQRDQSRRAAAFSSASRTSCSRCQTLAGHARAEAQLLREVLPLPVGSPGAATAAARAALPVAGPQAVAGPGGAMRDPVRVAHRDPHLIVLAAVRPQWIPAGRRAGCGWTVDWLWWGGSVGFCGRGEVPCFLVFKRGFLVWACVVWWA